VQLELDVSAVAPAGVRHLRADLFTPTAPRLATPVLLTCLPGGGMSRRYFDLDVPGYSMAAHLANAGFHVLLVDPPAIGDSDTPDDGWTLTPQLVATCVHEAVSVVLRSLRDDRPDLVSVGVGHSAGGLLSCYQQAAHRTHDALALLGFAGCGVPVALTDAERAYVDDPARFHADLRALVDARNAGDPLPVGSTATSDWLIRVPITDEVRASIGRSAAALLGLVGLTAMLPGCSAPELAAVDVPVFLGIAEHDIIDDPRAAPADFPGSSDVTLFVLRGAGHNHNVAPTRHVLWDRIASWAREIAPR
jgi:pimeloyl-ACP methyl ester carboxylesterase